MKKDAIKIFSGTSHPALAKSIAKYLEIPLGKSQVVKFSNDNLKIKILENVREEDVFVIQTSAPPVNEGLMELLIMIHALKYASAHRITAVLPYYPYARSDKKDEPRISITAALVADLLASAGADRVLTLDLHSPQEQGFFRIPSDHMTAISLLCEHTKKRDDLGDAVLVAADVGEAKDAGRAAKRLDLPLAIIDKRRSRDNDEVVAAHIIGDIRDKRVILVDDEIATGGTVLEASELLLSNGAKTVEVLAVHPVFSGPAIERLGNSPISRITVTDSIPISEEKRANAKFAQKLNEFSVAPLLANAIRSIHYGRSVSALFR